MIKRFLAVWGNWEPGAESYLEVLRSNVPIEYFIEVRGYSPDENLRIDNLEVHDCWHSPYGNHYVIRTK